LETPKPAPSFGTVLSRDELKARKVRGVFGMVLSRVEQKAW